MINFNVYYDNNSQKKINKTENFLISSDLKSKIKIINDIPRFCESEYTKNFGDQWSNYPEDQFDESNDETYKNLNIARDTLQEVFPIKLDKIENANILEAGSGNGRFTYIMLKNGAKVDTFDKSHAVDVLKNNLKKKNYLKNGKVNIAQVDINNMPYKKNSYDFVVCLHVLQHTPSPEDSINHLWDMVKPGGALIIDHYRFKIKSLYPPIGGFGNLFRHIVLLMPYKFQRSFSDSFVKFWFPLHWLFKDSALMQQILLRLSPVRFSYPWLGLKTKDAYFKKALMDTHDGSTDVYHHTRTINQIKKTINKLDKIGDFKVFKGGNGILAWAYKKSN